MDPARHTLTVLTRLAQRRPQETHKLAGALRGRLEKLGPTACEVAIETGDPIGRVLAEMLRAEPSPALADRLHDLIPGQTTALRDNNHCWANVGAPTTSPSGGAADACCGVVHYAPGDSVNMPYVAHHPHGFATHGINVFRSATGILSSSGGVGSFVLTGTVSDLMTLNLPPSCAGNPVCTMAAFSEHLEVYAMATDGWGSYLGFNAVADRAFALAP